MISRLLRAMHDAELVRLHFWRHSHGRGNRYMVCRVCGAREVRLSDGCYQPIDYEWLHSRPVVANVPTADDLKGTALEIHLKR